MKTTINLPVLLALVPVFLLSCQKEVSFELGNSKASVGTIQMDASGGCTGATVFGNFFKDSTLNASHYATVNVTVDSAGSYVIKTDTVQGYYFSAIGNFTSTGTQTVKLRAYGKPLSVGTHIFTLTYNNSVCDFAVTVLAGTGGTAAFTVSCTGATVNGVYAPGVPLTAANTVVLNVNVTAAGTWGISTLPAVNGIIFSGAGSFTATGAQTITLTASGTPAAAGTYNIPVAVGGASCNFPVVVAAPSDYFPRTINSNWSYEFNGVASDSLLVSVSTLTHTAAGNTFTVFLWTDNAALGFDTSGYYRRSGADYFEWIDAGTAIGLDNPVWIELNFLKDNLTAGATWNSQSITGTYTPSGGTPTSVTARFLYTILQQNTSVTVNGTAYPNTIVVKQELQQQIGGNWTTLSAAGYLQNYYSRNKGLIKQDYYDGNGTVTSAMNVRRLVVY